ncbi:hypothetical protein [Sinorhizobium fredii]|uniref:hypothetical protein n=1 Tax=Rhizobium fredii TaxID=380 RepID=UPI0004B4FCA9|nr:hypothetical protein [Sinorhizobium fredii]ASY73935.1 hypothetical protein SF83666_a43470 [Sinorhizobium fredii CCBAU 83666]
MSQLLTMQGRIDAYLAERRRLGFKGQARNATPTSWACRLEVLRPFVEHERRLDPRNKPCG